MALAGRSSSLARWRIQLAAALLASTAMQLAEIAQRVGHGSETSLSRAFKRLVGVAPASWARATPGLPRRACRAGNDGRAW